MLFIIIAAALTITAQSAEVRGEEKVLRFVDLKSMLEDQNERVRGRAIEAAAAENRRGTLLRSFLPTAEVQAGQERFKKGPLTELTQPLYGIELRMNLFNGGQDRLEDEQNSMIASRKRYEAQQVLADELAKAREIYWRILYLRDLNRLLTEARKSNKNGMVAAQRRIRAGVGTEIDRVEFEIRELNIKREIERTDLEMRNEARKLAVILGLSTETRFRFPEKLSHEHDWEEALKHTEEDHAFLVMPSELLGQEAEIESRKFRRSWWPKIEAFAAYRQLNQREEMEYAEAEDRQESVLGIRLTMSLLDGFVGRREAAALSASAQASSLEARYLKNEADADVHGEIESLRLLHSQVHEADANIKLAERYNQLTASEYARGLKNSSDVAGAQEKLLSAQQARLEIVRDFQISKSHVLAKIGR